MDIELTAMFRAVPGGFTAQIVEFPDARAEGETLDAARENLREAVRWMIATRRAEADELLGGAECVHEQMVVESRAGGGYRVTFPDA